MPSKMELPQNLDVDVPEDPSQRGILCIFTVNCFPLPYVYPETQQKQSFFVLNGSSWIVWLTAFLEPGFCLNFAYWNLQIKLSDFRHDLSSIKVCLCHIPNAHKQRLCNGLHSVVILLLTLGCCAKKESASRFCGICFPIRMLKGVVDESWRPIQWSPAPSSW